MTTAIVTAGVVALSTLAVAGILYPPSASSGWVTAFLTLLVLAILSQTLGVEISEEGNRTSFEFIAHLAAVQLIGPFGAASLAGLGTVVHQGLIARRGIHKATFNSAQVTISAVGAGLVYVLIGAQPTLRSLGFPHTLLPFLAAAITYSSLNTLAVSGIVAVSKGLPLSHAWRQIKGPILVADLAFSSVGYLTTLLYITWGPLALFLAILPLLGLRYFYAVNIKLQHLGQDLARVLVKTVEAQDPYTSGHSVRVAKYSVRLGRELGLGYRQLRQLETAALLHDLGKIDRAYSKILRQKGPLTDNQRALIEAHPERGEEMLKSVRALDDRVLGAVRHHHERWDGTGYPDELSEESTPIEARIIMVADTIDAMLTARSYRHALEVEDVRRELRACSGEQFDPQVVKAVFNSALLKKLKEGASPTFHHQEDSTVKTGIS